jgi:peptidoglycan/LPS O-acetylase OafA/YrhL
VVTLRQAGTVSPTEDLRVARTGQSEFRPDIEGLRAVAVLAVVLFHADLPGVGGGFVGVDVFFVISGFLITGLLWREVSTAGTVRLRRFYGARARRLLPASAAVGVITLVGSAVLLPLLQARSVIVDGIASALYVSNYWFVLEGVHYFGGHLPPSPFQHYWSLGVEEQFYLVWPAMIIGTAWLIRRGRRRSTAHASSSKRPYLVVLALVAAVSFAMSLVITYVMPALAFFSLPTRAWQLAAGGLVALTAGHWRRLRALPAAIAGWGGLALILLACTQLSAKTLYPGTAALLPVLGAVLVIGAGCAAQSQGCGRVLGLSPMRAIGRVSYSWYLWHWPVLVLAPVLLGHPLGLAARLAAALVSGGLAVLTLRFIENPLRFAATVRRSPVRSLALGGTATAVAVCVGVALLAWVPVPVGRGAPAAALTVTAAPVLAGEGMDAYDAAVRRAFAQVQAAVAGSAGLTAVPSNLDPPLAGATAELKAMLFNGCLREPFQGGQPECATGDTASTTTVALVGDSHAAMWNPAFQRLAAQRHWRLEMLAKGACPLMNLPIANRLFSGLVERLEHCEQWRGQIIARLRAEHPRLIVMSLWRGYGAGNGNGWLSGFTSYDAAWTDSLTRLVQQLRGTGAKVLVLGPVPDPHTSVPICLSGHLDDSTACSMTRSSAVNERGIATEWAATKAGGGQYADLTGLFCTTDRCPVIVGNTLVYIDETHLTLEYSRLLATVMGALADRAVARG